MPAGRPGYDPLGRDPVPPAGSSAHVSPALAAFGIPRTRPVAYVGLVDCADRRDVLLLFAALVQKEHQPAQDSCWR